MHAPQPIELVTMMLIEEPTTHQVLVEDKRNVPWKAGHSFPGGHVKVGESSLTAAIREVREETGIMVHTAQFCGTCEWFDPDSNRRKLGLLYRSADFDGTPRDSNEGRVYWLDRSTLTVANSAESLFTLLKVFDGEATAVVSPVWDGPLKVDTGHDQR